MRVTGGTFYSEVLLKIVMSIIELSLKGRKLKIISIGVGVRAVVVVEIITGAYCRRHNNNNNNNK